MSKRPNHTRRTKRPWQQYGIPEKDTPIVCPTKPIVARILNFFIPAKQVEEARENATAMNKELREQRIRFLGK